MVAAGWRPTVGNYLGRVTKPRILEAVREGLYTCMWDDVGILRTAESLQRGLQRLQACPGRVTFS